MIREDIAALLMLLVLLGLELGGGEQEWLRVEMLEWTLAAVVEVVITFHAAPVELKRV